MVRTRRRPIAAAIVIAAGVFAFVRYEGLMDGYRRFRLPFTLDGASSRPTAGRLTGLPYAPHEPRDSRGGDRAWRVSPAMVHASALLASAKDPQLVAAAMLMRGQAGSSVAELRKAAAGGDPRALSDLSAALREEAEELRAYPPALDAIAAARQAIAVAPDLPAAHFNLAMALDYIGLVNEARDEFRKAAALEPRSKWADEALQRAQVRGVPPRDWELVRREFDAALDDPTRHFVVRENLELARAHADRSLLREWSTARVGGHRNEAARTLLLLRAIGRVSNDLHRDRFLLDTVARIDEAERSGEKGAQRMAAAVHLYSEGRYAALDAQGPILTRAAAALAAAGSPLQYAARNHRAGTLYEKANIDEALAAVAELEAERLDRKGYRTLSTQVGWNRGICLLVRGSYPEALQEFEKARATCVAMGDESRAADFDGLAAEALEYLGDSREAWERRARALRVHSAYPVSRIPVVLTSAASLQLAARQWARAEVLVDYALPLALRPRGHVTATHAFAQRAVARYELGDIDGARSDHGRAVNRIGEIDDEELRERLQVEVDVATSAAIRATSPRAAIAHLGNAIASLQASGQSAALPRLYAERARTYEALGDVQRRRQDLRAGLAVVEGWEQNIGDRERRAAISIWSETMRRDLIALELDAGDVAAAFSYADDRHTAANVPVPMSLREVRAGLAASAAILEYVVAGDRVIVFIIRSDSARALTLPASATRIGAAAKALRTAGEARFPRAAATMHELLLAPLLPYLETVGTIAFVPDRELSGIPFGALRDARGAYLLEHVAVMQAPSATAAIALSRRAPQRSDDRVLAIGASDFDRERYPDAARLHEVEKEAQYVGRTSAHSETLVGRAATADALEAALVSASLIHYAGHIVDRGADARLLLSPSGDRNSLSAREIGALRLVARVAILAACRGSGTAEPTAVVQDMASGFLKAGVPTVIASTSDVADDKAPQTMQSLHKFLREGADPAEALRRTAVRERSQGQEIPLSIRFLVMGGSRLLVR